MEHAAVALVDYFELVDPPVRNTQVSCAVVGRGCRWPVATNIARHCHSGFPVAQGAGQALSEELLYDADGQLLTGSFMDYAMPRADDLVGYRFATSNVPTRVNPLGVKGVGEAGTVGALCAVMNAVNDALRPLGVRHLDMPATPHRIWSAIRQAKDGSP